jgi:hypothetical protein
MSIQRFASSSIFSTVPMDLQYLFARLSRPAVLSYLFMLPFAIECSAAAAGTWAIDRQRTNTYVQREDFVRNHMSTRHTRTAKKTSPTATASSSKAIMRTLCQTPQHVLSPATSASVCLPESDVYISAGVVGAVRRVSSSLSNSPFENQLDVVCKRTRRLKNRTVATMST